MLRRRNAELIGLFVQRTQRVMLVAKAAISQKEIVRKRDVEGRSINRTNT